MGHRQRDPGPQDIVVHVEDARVAFGDEVAVDGISFDVPRGTIFGFIGPSGSGKTTTVRFLTGVLAPDDGEVRVFGRRPGSFTAWDRARLGYMPQLSVLYPNLSVWENLNFVASMYGMGLRRRRRLREVLALVELDGHERKLLRDTSGGMQRRLALAATLVHQPDVLFLDEPTAGIDPVLRRKLWDHFEYLRDLGRTLFVTTQYVGEAAYCDCVGVLAEGRVIAVDTPEGLRRRAYGGEVVEVSLDTAVGEDLIRQLATEPGVVRAEVGSKPHELRLVVDDAQTAIPAVQQWVSDSGRKVATVHEVQEPFDDVFVTLLDRELRPEPSSHPAAKANGRSPR